LWLHSLKVAQLLRSAACLHTNQSRSYLNHLVCHSWFLAYIQFPARKVEPWLYLRIDIGCYESGHHSGRPTFRASTELVQRSNFVAVAVICADFWSRTFQVAVSLTKMVLGSGFRVPTTAWVLCTFATTEESV